MKEKMTVLLICATLAALAAPAKAEGLCSTGGATEGISVGDMTYSGRNATDCYGAVIGNINESNFASLLNNSATIPGSTWGTGWTYLAKDEGTSGTGTYQGIQFGLTADDIGDKSGTWTLTATDTNGPVPLNLPTSLDLIGVLKGGNKFALWFFDDVAVTADNQGTWQISFTNRGGRIPGLSHMDLLVRPGNGEVPEPGGLALFGLGMAGIAAIRRRKA